MRKPVSTLFALALLVAVAVFALVMIVPDAQAQFADLQNPNSPPAEGGYESLDGDWGVDEHPTCNLYENFCLGNANGNGPDWVDCDDIFHCEVYKTVYDLDAAVPNATIFGLICSDAIVSVGQDDGTMAVVTPLGIADNYLTIDLTGMDASSVRVEIECFCFNCEACLTIGDDGPEGPEGPEGIVGPDGPVGDEGEMGAQGATGPTGPKGPKGAKGAKGGKGEVGPTGPTGPTGPDGVGGDPCADVAGGAPSDCCVSNGTPGCTDPECEALICGFDPYCCSTNWDSICASEALAEDVCLECC